MELMTENKFDYFINWKKGKWEVIICLEVHAQVLSKSKLFSSSSAKFGADPNFAVSPKLPEVAQRGSWILLKLGTLKVHDK